MLERLWKRILWRSPYSFWDLPAFLLWLCSFVYRLLFNIHRMMASQPERVSVPVLSVGNITVGGTGKTPLVSFIARDLLAAGVRVGIVSSGYGRTGEGSFVEPGYKVETMDVAVTGDEIMLLARLLSDAVFSIDRTKLDAARRLADSGAVDMIIVDDGFQHIGLARDIDLVAYDAGIRKCHLKAFPYGLLREPKSALSRADVIIITRAKFAFDINAIKRDLRQLAPNADLYHAGFVCENLVSVEQTRPVKYLEDKSVFLFAGVGNFRSLRRQVSALSGDLDGALELSDHQVYDNVTLAKIRQMAEDHDSDVIVTTFKDWVKLGDFDFGREIYYLDLAVDLDPGEEKLATYVRQTLQLGGQEEVRG